MIASPTGSGPVPLDPLADRRPLDVLEGDVVIPAVVADRVDPGDVLVVEPGRGPALLVEPLDDLGVARLLGRQDLQGDVAVELGVDGPEDRPHPADADGLLQLEDVDPLAGDRQRGDVRALAGPAPAIRRPARGRPPEAETMGADRTVGGSDPRPDPPHRGRARVPGPWPRDAREWAWDRDRASNASLSGNGAEKTPVVTLRCSTLERSRSGTRMR